MKRKRSEELVAEYERQLGTLNRTFLKWLRSCKEANPFTTWEEACKDYVTHAEQLTARFCTLGTASAFGSGDCGQLGFGVEGGDEDLSVDRARQVLTLKDKPLAAIVSGGLHNAAVAAEDGTVWTWGCADDNVLGREGDENFPAPVSALQGKVFVIAVSAGDCHTTALTMHGQVYIWGTYKDKDGRNWWPAATGEESFKRSEIVPTLVDAVSDIAAYGGATQVASGANHTVALCGDGTVFAWGIGECGQLGRKVCELKDKAGIYRKDDVLREHLTPAVMRYATSGEVKNARYIAAGHHHTFVLQAARSRAFGCGLNQYGQLGLPEGTPTELLQPIHALNGLGVSTVHGAEHSSLAVTHDGKVYTFGRSDNSQLGVELDSSDAGSFTCKPQLVAFDPPARIQSAACGSFHCAAVARDGSLYTWGFGVMAQLGHGSDKDGNSHDEKRPRKVLKSAQGGPLKVAAVAAGAQHTLVLEKIEG